eukprot:2776175-Alexandrium_andersonii.AAC.1
MGVLLFATDVWAGRCCISCPECVGSCGARRRRCSDRGLRSGLLKATRPSVQCFFFISPPVLSAMTIESRPLCAVVSSGLVMRSA